MKHPDDRFPIQSFLLIISILTLIRIPKSFCQNPQYDACGQVYSCGNMQFEYPFWGGNRPESCGYPGFEVTCVSNSYPRITISSESYRVIESPDTGANTVTVAREDLYNDVCSGVGQDTRMDLNLFSYPSNYLNLTLSYACNTPPTSVPTLFNCNVNGDNTSIYYAVNANIPGCDRSITVPISQAAPANFVNISSVLKAGIALTYEANNGDCQRCTQSNGRCGYDTGSRSFVCYCSDRAYTQVCNGTAARTPNGNGNQGLSSNASIGLAMGGAVLAGIGVGWLIFWYRQRRKRIAAGANASQELPPESKDIYRKSSEEHDLMVQEFMRDFGSIAPKLYTYSEVRKMTNSFTDKLGHGGYGCVYRGKLPDGRRVAVKVLNDNKGNGEDFINEVASISRTSHVNIVTLLGFCHNNRKRALIYEFMPNGSLDKFICKKESPPDTVNHLLEWKLLYKITVGIARGLEYLHRGCNTRIVHFDIKPQNILLDADFCPKISDFGLARSYKSKDSILSTMTARGTIGYIAPEVIVRSFGGVSHKSDVYSYGMMVLEIVGLRRKPEIDSQQTSDKYFPDWIYERMEAGRVHLPLEGVSNEEEEETAMKMTLVGLWCVQINPAERPSIGKVVEMLEGSLQSIQFPPKPSFVSPSAMSFNLQSWTTSSTS